MKRSLFKVCKGYLKLESYCPIKLGVWSDSSCKSVIENTSLLHGNTNVSGYTWTQLLIAFSSFFGNFGFRFSTGGDDGPREIPRGGTVTMDLDVSLEDLYKGKFIEVCATFNCFNIM